MSARIRAKKTKISSESMERNFKRSDYSQNTSSRASKIWNYFARRDDGFKALCTVCESQGSPPVLIPTKDYNTTGIVKHLLTKHNISLSTPNSDHVADRPASISKPKIARVTDFFKSKVSMYSLIAELAAKDRISFANLMR
ncbi:unnamed protein product [Allacma fusca]|uniref:BED-type domain-containing protein n=1 Tax=Allacma fusca TaxID=39272 RepID=A0A8J2JIP6_9HEXA|nr:unnamed protein product [Allacma fusca]